MSERGQRLGEAAWQALSRLVRERLSRRPGGHLVGAELGHLELRLPLSGPDASPERFALDLCEQIDERLDEAIRRAAAFRPGRAYCHRCSGAECEHSWPTSARHVFVGYSPTGTPRWLDLAQWCLEIRHPQVDRLYDDPPAFVTLLDDGEVLQERMLGAFRHQEYELVGQVVAGFFRVRTPAEQGRGVLALSFQAIAWRSRSGATRYGLNLLGRAPSGAELASLWDALEELPWRRPVQWAQTALAGVAARSTPGGRPAHAEARVHGILQGLARRLERDQRARSRRTRHAERRHASGERPTRKAQDDAREARAEACLVDERTGTVVVLGERGRTHFFTPDGQHVSSVRYSPEAIARKIQRERWREASEEETAALRAKLDR